MDEKCLKKLRVDPEQLARLTPAEYAEVQQELLALERLHRENPLLGYEPHDKQVVFHSPPFPRSRLFLGGNRSGKTTASMVDTILQACDRDVVPQHLQQYKRWEPPFYARVVIPDLTRSLEGVTLQKFREWCPRGQLKGKSMDRAWDKVQLMLRFANGSWVQFMSNDQDLDKFGGAALHRVIFDEEPRQDIRRECLMRLIDYGGEELFSMTPLAGMSWVYDEFFEPWESGKLNPQMATILLVDMDDNPHLNEEAKEFALEGLSHEERQARKSGRFVAFAGLIYPEFREQHHVCPQPSELPHGVEVFCGIDPGYRHLCAVVYAFLDQDDRMVVFDEICLPQTRISEICKQIKVHNARWGVVPNFYVIDPAARNKNNQTGRSDQQEFADYGVYTIPGQNAVTAGINHVKERLAADKLFVAAPCQELRSEFRKYRWVKENPRTEQAATEKPVKKDDHALDALRYVVMQRPLAPAKARQRPSESRKDWMLRKSLERLRGRDRGGLEDFHGGPGVFRA